MGINNVYLTVNGVVLSSIAFQTCSACSGASNDDSGCWYTLWYIWFVLALFVVVIAVLIVLYVKHRSKERSRARRRRRSTRTQQIHIVPAGPPGYAEPSHKPPSYDEAMQQPPPNNTLISTISHNNTTTHSTHNAQPVQVPGIIPCYHEDYGYQPPPTSMRMVSNTQSSSPLPQPPSYSASIHGQRRVQPS